MFQNISAEDRPEEKKDVEFNKKDKMKIIVRDIFTKQNILLYIISFMLSVVNPGIGICPFGFAIFSATCSNGVPAGIIYVITLIGCFIGFGANGLLSYILASLLFIGMILVFRPVIQDGEVNEKRKLGIYVFFAIAIVQAIRMIFEGFTIYDAILSAMAGITVYIFYKIFCNSLIVFDQWGIKKAFSIEEVIGASLMTSIALLSLGDLAIFGFEVKNILSILIILILGWKNGILLGATSGITIGSALGILGNGEPVMIAAFAVSGMIAGVFYRLGKIGVIFGFVLGTIILTYATNGNTSEIIYLKEILIASLGLLLVPKKIEINIEDIFGKNLYLPVGASYRLEQSKETVNKLNTVSKTIKEMSEAYKEVAATVAYEKDIKENKEKQIFIDELINNLENLEDNLLYDDLMEEEIIGDIFDILKINEVVTRKDIIEVFEKYNNYIVGFDNEDANMIVEQDLNKILKVINHTYEVGKINYLWEQKMKESKKTISNQLEGVSKVISSVASEIDEKQKHKERYKKKQEEIIDLCKVKDIQIEDIIIKQEENSKYIINMYMNPCDESKIKECPISKIEKILSKVLEDEIVISKNQCAMKKNDKVCKQTYRSKDRYLLQLGVAKKRKDGMSVSGDTSLHTRLEDGKYLIAISDGMGSGPEASKSSKIAIKMLERLLKTGFDKDTSIELMNQSMCLSTEDEMYATVDVMILDLYTGNAEFIKNGACPTYFKDYKTVDLIKSISLPAGILNNIDLVTYDRDINENEIFIMCSDGILEANTEFQNKELWIKNLLEQIQTDNVQKIADIILKEAIDCGYGTAKDDMTIFVGKIIHC